MNSMDNKSSIGNALALQYDKIFNMTTEGIDKVSEKLWKLYKNDWRYAWNSFHIVETISYHLQDGPNEMKWGERAGINWEKDKGDSLIEKMNKITKDLVKSYIIEVKENLNQKFKNTSDAEFLSKDEFGYFSSNLERHIYSIRHAIFHAGELNKTLRDNNEKRIKWQ